MSLDDRLHQLILDIHEKALGETEWIHAAGSVAERLGAYGVTTVLHGLGEANVIASAMAGYRDLDFENILQEYTQHYHDRNPQALFERARSSALYYIDGEDPVFTPANYPEFSRWETDRIGIRHHATGYCRPTEDLTFAFAFSGSAATGPFSTRQLALFRLFMGHFRQAVGTAHRLQTLPGKRTRLHDRFADYLESLPDAAFTLDAHAHVVFANSAALALVRAGDGLVLSGGVLRLQHADTNRRFRHLCASVGELASGTPPGGMLAVARPSGRRPYLLEVRVLPRSQEMAAGNAAVALLIVHDIEQGVTVEPEHLVQLFGLTRAEARVAATLFATGRLERVAETHGVSLGTVRIQLKRIFAKTETTRQSELLSLLARIAR